MFGKPRHLCVAAGGGALVLAASLAGCAWVDSLTAPDRPRNVLLISIDSLRADRLGVYGNPRETSPTIDRLAGEGTRFARAYSPSSWTLPSHATLLTGFFQRRHGAVGINAAIREGLPTLASVLSRHGFETRGVFSGPFVHGKYGFDRGFDEYVDCQGYDDSKPLALAQSHSAKTNACVRQQVNRWARAASTSTAPFFWFVHLWDVHYDYDPPPKYVAEFDPLYRGKLNGRRIPHEGFPLEATARDVAHLLARYDGEIRYVDDTIGVLLRILRNRDLLDHTLVVITADHGDEFREHGGKGHQRTLHSEVVHVPLVLWGRGAPRGRVVDAPVGIVDVTPTILDLLDVPAPSLDGASLRGLMVGTSAEARPVVSVLYFPLAAKKKAPIVSIAVRDETTTLIRPPMASDFVQYDRRHDPLEQMPLPIRTPDEQARARAAEVRAAMTSGEKVRAKPVEISPAIREHLRELGYIE